MELVMKNMQSKSGTSSTSWGANSGANAWSNINLNINNNATHTDIASAINWSNDLSKITKDELQKALREKIKNSDNTIDEDKINKILEALKDNLKKE
jgi:LPS O-antigen subunit length determinant protein (WzzB/FepE family)